MNFFFYHFFFMSKIFDLINNINQINKDFFVENTKNTISDITNKFKEIININQFEGFGYNLIFPKDLPKENTIRTSPIPIILENQYLQELILLSKLSDLIYEDSKNRILPIESGLLFYEKKIVDGNQIPFFITKNDLNKKIFIVCRGSWTFNDLKIDLNAKSIKFKNGYVHEGVYYSSLFVFEIIKEILKYILIENSNFEIIITGHSLGAGVASLTTLHLKDFYPEWNCKCICFASPPIVSKEIWEITSYFTSTFIYSGDPIPYMCLKNFYQIYQNKIPNNLLPLISDLQNYPLYPPGKLFHIIPPKTNDEKIYIGFINNLNYFENLVEGLNECDHFMTKYIQAIENVIENQTLNQ